MQRHDNETQTETRSELLEMIQHLQDTIHHLRCDVSEWRELARTAQADSADRESRLRMIEGALQPLGGNGFVRDYRISAKVAHHALDEGVQS